MKTIKEIRIRFISQSEQRYDTTGDWLYEGDVLHILVTQMPDERHQQLVAVHELVECLACNVDGVTQEQVDAFDMGPGADLDEPGMSPDAPYRAQHMMATQIERCLADSMHVDWLEYDAAVGDHGVRETSDGRCDDPAGAREPTGDDHCDEPRPGQTEGGSSVADPV